MILPTSIPRAEKTCSISACRTSAQRKMFERVAETLHGTDPAFVPPFPGSVAKYLSPKSAFHIRHGEITGFVAIRAGRPVGRIAAIINRSHNERYSDKTGFFGFFECENDPATGDALFREAGEVLRAAGMDHVRGPYNPSINDECGLLADRFDLPPVIGLTWNPEYYLSLVAGCPYVSLTFLKWSMSIMSKRAGSPERATPSRVRSWTARKWRRLPSPVNGSFSDSSHSPSIKL